MIGAARSAGAARRRVAVVGAGWAGLACAVQATLDGHSVQVFEMAPQPGGRARRAFEADGFAYDNGQHILIGAYAQTVRLMRAVGADPDALLMRRPLALCDAAGRGLVLPPGRPTPAFVRGVLGMAGYSWRERAGLLAAATGWLLRGFRCDAGLTVAQLCSGLPQAVLSGLIEPLCVAALNTPAHEASAAVLLRVLRDALFAVPGGSDLLLPRVDLQRLFPAPASAWLQAHGAQVALGKRVDAVRRASDGWHVGGAHFDAVVLAASAAESARLAEPHDASWARQAAALPYEPIATVYTPNPGPALGLPMLALASGPEAPAQFVFDLGQLRGQAGGGLAFVVSGARAWVERGREALVNAVATQASAELGLRWPSGQPGWQLVVEKRATFLCRPALARPPGRVAPGLWAAGDYVAGPYPATLEGAVRSGVAAAAHINST